MGVTSRSPKGRAAARGLDARLRLQHAFMPAGDASLKTAQLIKMLVDSNHGIYRNNIAGAGLLAVLLALYWLPQNEQAIASAARKTTACFNAVARSSNQANRAL